MVQRPSSNLPAADIARVLFGLIVPRAAVAEVAPPAASEAPAPASPEAPRGDSGRSSFVRGGAPWSDAARAFLRAGAPPAMPLLPAGPVLLAQGSQPTLPTGAQAAQPTVAPTNAAPTNAAPTNAVPTTGPAPKLAQVSVVSETTSRAYGPTPWVWNQWLPDNKGRASKEYKHWAAMNGAAEAVGTTHGKLEGAKAAEVAAQGKAAAARQARDLVVGDSTKLPAAEKALRDAETGYTKAKDGTRTAQTAYDRAVAKVESTSKDFKAFLKTQLPTIYARDPELQRIAEGAKQADRALKAEKAKGPDAGKVRTLEKELRTLERAQGKAPTAERAKTIDEKKAALAAEQAIAPDPARVQALQSEIKTAQAARATRKTALAAEVDAYQPVQPFDRKTTVVEIDGQRITLRDHTQAYSSEKAGGLGGSARDGGQAGVNTAVDASRLGADDKLIMKEISKHEGRFSTTESYDIGGVTWGMMQWTTGVTGDGSVIAVMNKIKADHPAAYKAAFSDYGIDTKNGKLTVTRPDGTVLSGASAVEAVRTEPKLSAVFAAAGTRTEVQAVQIELAKKQKIDADGLDRGATVSVNGQSHRYTARQIFTSEWGAAVVANAGVHAGPGNVERRLQEGLTAFFAANPKLDPARPATWAAQAETFIAARMIGGDADRARSFEAAGLSKTAGSYGP